MAEAFFGVVPKRQVLWRRYLTVSSSPSLEVDLIVESKAYFHAALNVVVVFTIILRAPQLYPIILFANDTAFVRFLRLDSIQLDRRSGGQSDLVEPKSTRQVNPPVETITRSSSYFTLLFLYLIFFQWRYLSYEKVFFFLYVESHNVLKS